jgi:hypothetical protein
VPVLKPIAITYKVSQSVVSSGVYVSYVYKVLVSFL